MTSFRVWAPYAQRVELELHGRRLPMEPEQLLPSGQSSGRDGKPAPSGWYACSDVEAEPGTDYSFVLDGDPLPDPRSGWQPAGVHGPSRLVDHEAFEWHDQAWRGIHLPSAVIYELHVGTFSPQGTFEGVISQLDHLVDLGVTAVELMPVAEFPGRRGWGYDGVDLYAPHHAYGGPDGLKRLVDACHAKGLGVILDVVYNHLGPSGNYLGRYGPYFTDRYQTPWGQAVNFDGPGSDEVREFVIGNAIHWLRHYHFDGLRIDAVHAIVDTSATHILEELATRVEELAAALGRDLFLVAESDLNDPRVVRRREVGGYGMDAQWSDDFHHALHTVLTGERNGYYSDFGSISQLATALRQAIIYSGQYSPHRDRRHGRGTEGLSAHRFLGYLQNHDQIGNRAQGERSSMLMSTESLKTAAALVFTSPFIPMLFQGEEWGASSPFQYFTDHEDPQLGRAVSEGRRREFSAFGWAPEEIPDPQDPETFERSKLDWSELRREPHASILAWHRWLIRLRRESACLNDGRFDRVGVRYDEGERWLVMERHPLQLACNFSDEPQHVPGVAGPVVASSTGEEKTEPLSACSAVITAPPG